MKELRKSVGKMIIIAHPNPQVRKDGANRLRECGWKVISVDSTSLLYSRIGAWPHSLILLATDMPDESGWLACHKIRKSKPQAPVFLVQESIEDADRSLADFVGASGIHSFDEMVTKLSNPFRVMV